MKSLCKAMLCILNNIITKCSLNMLGIKKSENIIRLIPSWDGAYVTTVGIMYLLIQIGNSQLSTESLFAALNISFICSR